ncbi:MAG TPA: extracellular solute-binding protein [Candidatus Onthomonas avicola]|nr:extracellular solute-binding protein [Candidatus Onthomonas avicola]
MKKWIALILALCLLVCALAGCAPEQQADTQEDTGTTTEETQEPADETPAETEESTGGETPELLVARWAGATADYQKEQVRSYTEANVTIDDVDYSSLKEREILSFQSAPGTEGNYDVVWVNSAWITEYIEAGYLMSINDLAETAGVDLSIYDEGLMSSVTHDGEIYGIPTFLQCIICAYDTAAFDEMGLSVPTNYSELVEVSAALKEAGDGLAMPASQANGAYTVWSQLLFSQGASLVEDGALTLTSDASVAATERYQELAQYAADGSLGWAHEGVFQALQSGASSLGLMMSGNCSNLHDESASLIADTVGYFPFYGYEDTAAANQTYWVWAIPANCDNPQAAFDFISWLCSYEVEKQSSLDMYTISAITALAEDEELLETVPFAAIVMDEFADGQPDPQNANFDALKTDLSVALSEVALNAASGGSDIAGLLGGLQEQYGGLDWS